MRISDWSSDVCSSDLRCSPATNVSKNLVSDLERGKKKRGGLRRGVRTSCETKLIRRHLAGWPTRMFKPFAVKGVGARSRACSQHLSSEEHTSELHSLILISYAVFCFYIITFFFSF